MASLDLSDAYLQVPVHPESRRFLRFCVGEEVWQFRALCFGLSTAPQAFTRVMAPISSIMHRHEFRILRYLDDWLVLGSSFQNLVRARDFLLWLCQDLGIQVNLEKSSLTPTQSLDYLGMRLQTLPLRVFPTSKRVLKLNSLLTEFTSCQLQPLPLWRQLVGVMSSLASIVPGSRLRMRSLQLRLNSARLHVVGCRQCSLGFFLPRGSSVVVRRRPSSRRPSSGSLSARTFPIHRRFGFRLGGLSRRRPPFRLVVSPLLCLFHQPSGTSCSPLRSSGFSSSVASSVGQPVCGQHHRSGLPAESRGYSFLSLQIRRSSDLADLRNPSDSFNPSVHPRSSQCLGGLPQSSFAGPRVGVDPVFSCLPEPPSPVAGDHRFVRDGVQPPSSGGHGCDDAAVGWSSGLRLSSLRHSPACHREGPAVMGAGAHASGSLLASAPVVLGSSGASGGCSGVPSTSEGSTQTAPLPSLSPEPPRALPDCVSYIGFSSSVARQLARCRRSSTRVNYQAKWAVYWSWCSRHGHSVSRPTVPKVASFLLYLRRSLSLSYSSIASYRSMLSVIFRFILPELSSHFVPRDLLRSFRLERPVSSSRVPLWDLSLVLSFLRGPPFEPLSSCSLRDLTRKVLFLLSLATACRVGELQALSSQVSFSGDDLFLSYLPEFRAKTESAVRPLPRSFPVRSLRDFVGSLPEELLLCPVRALRMYLSHTASLPSRPRSLFASPRAPSRSLSKNALSFFIREVISEAYSSSGRSLPSRPPPSSASSASASASSSPASSSSSSRPRSSLRAHGVRGVAASWAFHRNAPLASILESATWSSPSVFTSFYLSDVQFSSSSGYGLGPVVAAGSVV